ncbi:hypothetical protein QCA50_008789 [Cerrena zonata]|uniref:Uncharacterized protein n=1 Tax=Cerrena zonata TaxID=2478898 RepID=A0AAW0G505_9APHY
MHPSLDTSVRTSRSWFQPQSFRLNDGHSLRVQNQESEYPYLSRPASPSSNTNNDHDNNGGVDRLMASVGSTKQHNDGAYDSDSDSEDADDHGYVNTCDRCPTCIPRHRRIVQRFILSIAGYVTQYPQAPTVDNSIITAEHSVNAPLADVGNRHAERGSTSHSAPGGQRLYKAVLLSVDEGALPGVLPQDKNPTL